jgi:hypothetical protein
VIAALVDPFGARRQPGPTAASVVLVAFLVSFLAAVRFAKGRVLLGVVGLFVPVVALVGAARLGHPSSLWARWRYDDSRRARAARRFAADRPLERTGRRAADLIAGAPTRDRT